MSNINKEESIVENNRIEEEMALNEVIEYFFDDKELDEYYEQLGKEILQRSYLKCGPYWDKIKELKEEL